MFSPDFLLDPIILLLILPNPLFPKIKRKKRKKSRKLIAKNRKCKDLKDFIRIINRDRRRFRKRRLRESDRKRKRFLDIRSNHQSTKCLKI
jgi:hypothetical protein